MATEAERKAQGARITAARRARKMSKTTLGRELGLKQPTGDMYRHESGLRGVNHHRLKAIAEILKVPLRWLETGQGPNGIDQPVEEVTQVERRQIPEAVIDYLATGRGGEVTPHERAVLAAVVHHDSATTLDQLDAFLRTHRKQPAPAAPRPRRASGKR